jgi:GMP synthase-like glutamine amidotransferase
MKHVSVIQHTQSEWLGQIEDHLEGRGIRFGYSRPFTTGGSIPEATVAGDGLILLGGGPWSARMGSASAASGRTLPTLEAEVRLARACLMLGKPVIGFGLGSQILALAAEGGVDAAPLALTVGEALRVTDGALGGLLPARFPNVVYMRDRPRPPDYASILAVDAEGNPALFQIGSNAFGFSGHPGVRRAMIEDLVMEFEEAPADAAAGLDRLTALGPAIDDALVPIMAGLIAATGWMAG